MNPRQLEVFHAMMSSSSMTEAARSLSVSQPAVSAILKHTESQLGLKLFERVGGRLVPTPEAERLFPAVELVFAQLGNVNQLTRTLREVRTSLLSVIVNPTLDDALVTRAVSQLVAKNPRTRIRVETAFARQIFDRVTRGEFDLGLLYGPNRYMTVGSDVIGGTTIACAIPKDHPLAARAELTPKDLAATKVITFAPGTPFRNLIDNTFSDAGVKLRVAAEVSSSLAGALFARDGVGVALIDPLITQSEACPAVAIRPLMPRLNVQIHLLAPKSGPRSRLSVELGELLSANLRLVHERNLNPV